MNIHVRNLETQTEVGDVRERSRTSEDVWNFEDIHMFENVRGKAGICSRTFSRNQKDVGFEQVRGLSKLFEDIPGRSRNLEDVRSSRTYEDFRGGV